MQLPALDAPPYAWPEDQKRPALLDGLNTLVAWHRDRCAPYDRWLSLQGLPHGWRAERIEDLPAVTVPIFKQHLLSSVPEADVFKILRSSGTTGQVPSRVVLDRDTAALQSRTLVRIMQHWLGRSRRPMLLIDHPAVITDRSSFTARGAGIQGLSFMGRNHTYALREDMTLDVDAVRGFAEQHAGDGVLLFGFTFMVWRYFIQALREHGVTLDLRDAVLLHSGGWKKLQAEAVDNDTFVAGCTERLGGVRVHNFYGMVEQVGSVFVACEHGRLHCPAYADIIVREPGSWRALPPGEAGVIELLSLVPRSYPGHALLTEDRGRILGVDDCPCGRMGRTFEVLGRMVRAEVRGCGDTFQATPGAP